MKVQPINLSSFSTAYHKNVNTKKLNQTAPIDCLTFKSYEGLLRQIVKSDIKSGIHADNCFNNLYKSLDNDFRAIKTPELRTLEQYKDFNTDIWKFLNTICQPIAKVPSNLRDIVLSSETRDIPLVKLGEFNTSFLLTNGGKHGLWGKLFNSQDARNNLKFIFRSGNDKYKIGLTGDKWLWTRQSDSANWQEGTYGLTTRRTHKSGAFWDINSFPPF